MLNEQISESLDRLSDLDASGLSELEGSILSAFSELETTDDPTPDSVQQMTELADALDSVRGELTRRSEQAVELKAKAEALSSRVKETAAEEAATEETCSF